MRRTCRLILAFLVILPVVFAQSARERNAAQEWPTYNGDLAGTRFSPLNQINTRNVKFPSWPRFKDRNMPPHILGEITEHPGADVLNADDEPYAKVLGTLNTGRK